ncbi:MAG TPA: Crp/Fnr family transcriptional regulator [Brevefilum fermentans]|jgi:CRP/FNR family transcriptional regulator|uniref:Putative Crp/FNR family transcriptional regulator n=1 Tax=Candidatus Brevifilum fermentans TaxID=1986204 RepID=A0A1Y6K7N4_9CHLR|nr:Crp/Fnr family transcriptional regulator [Brevefilum fermentans]MDI9566860.1 Crp/Fnr family transcriptional regulator [Chloroflexota bacterium]OQB82891.1 MAG: cAMP-activated global transcriptional regulator CRP [Chloroflexi bacterium ADurb.Bin120]SMX54898.1 putative Crp/FNR family transcriptional regulator [Brevefilum fermentans]HOM67393.1 Crp/Fnr family transcriptional regulator [Brevefilum fermentans]HPX94938.1 Crp/Fnr family transcriptional regulator [Brevefilum fermentans]
METDHINQLPIFAGLAQETRLELARRSYIRELPAGHTLLLEGMPAESAYVLVSGEARAFRMNREGRVQILARFKPGDPINIISLLNSDKLNRATIEALSPMTVLVIRSTDFEALITRYPDFSKMLLHHLADRLAKITDLAAGLSLFAVRARLARFLIELADLSPSSTGWTQDEIAAHVGTVRDVVGRLLRDFEAGGLIQRQRGQIILLDREKLIQAARE